MNAERKDAAVKMLEGLRSDIQIDVRRRDGMPLTGATVAQALGEVCAQVDALARVLIEVLQDPIGRSYDDTAGDLL